MPVTLAAALLTAADPRPVQITLNGTTLGQEYEIRGTTADGSSWPVPGGKGVSAGSQVLLIDNRSALNALITYQAVVDGVTYTATPLTVTGPTCVVQTSDGLDVVEVEIKSRTEPRSHPTRSSLSEIARRREPAGRLDVPGSPIYKWVLETEGPATALFEAILATGKPIVRRTVTGLRDLKPVVLGVVISIDDELSSEGFDTWRSWALTVREIGDPQPSTALAAYTWDDFDAAMADRVWSYHTLFPATTGWAGTNGTLSLLTSGGYLTPNYLRATAIAAATAVDIFESAYTAAAASLGKAVTPGLQVTETLRIKGTPGRSGMAAIKWSNGTIVTGTPVTLTGAWQQVSVTATAPGGVTGVALGARMASTGVAIGNQLDISAPTISEGATVPIGSFDELFSTWDQFDAADWALL